MQAFKNRFASRLIPLSIGAFGFMAGWYYGTMHAPTAGDPKSNTASTVGQHPASFQGLRITNENTHINTVPWSWASLESTNYVTYIANLEAVGCPRQTIVDIITADIDQLYRKKIDPLLSQLRNHPSRAYWLPARRRINGMAELEPLKNQIRELDRERRTLLTKLLGSQFRPGDNSVVEAMITRAVAGDPGPLTDVQQEHLERLREEHQKQLRNRFKGGEMTMEDSRKYMQFVREFDDQLAKEFGPEWARYQELRNSITAQEIRRKMGDSELTQEEFDRLYQALKPLGKWADQHENSNDVRADDLLERTSLKQQAIAEIKEQFGETKAQTLLDSWTFAYETMDGVLSSAGFTPDQIRLAYQSFRDVGSRSPSSRLDDMRSTLKVQLAGVMNESQLDRVLDRMGKQQLIGSVISPRLPREQLATGSVILH